MLYGDLRWLTLIFSSLSAVMMYLSSGDRAYRRDCGSAPNISKHLIKSTSKNIYLQFPVAWKDDPASAHPLSVGPEQRTNTHLQTYLPRTAHPQHDWTPSRYTCALPTWRSRNTQHSSLNQILRSHDSEQLHLPRADTLPWRLGAKQNQSFVIVCQSSITSWCWQDES